jgi:putative phosphoribosyl transferase
MFRDREEAGRRLGEYLKERLTVRGEGCLVLGIPRGGVVVAEPVAEALGCVLDVIVPRKIGAPGNAELAIGALALVGDEEIALFDKQALSWLAVSEEHVQREVARERREIARREEAYREGRPPAAMAGKMVVIVDDGIATGLTARAGAAAAQRAQVKDVLVAAPVAPPDAARDFERLGLRLEVLETPSPFMAVGRFYEDFRTVEDDEVRAVLARWRST